MNNNEILTQLNGVQRDAVVHGEGPALVVAGAGSGKTRVLTHRIAYLINSRGIAPHEVLAITFTNKAADEVRERVVKLIGPAAKTMWISTFHRACVRILRQNAHHIDYPNSFTIYGQTDSASVVRDTIRDLNYDPKQFPHRAMQQRISRAKNALQSAGFVAETAEAHNQRVLDEVYDEYQKRLHAAGAMDFDDLLLLTVQLLSTTPDVLEHYQRTFSHILVDEYQDTNAVQNKLVTLLGRDHSNVFVVGDSDQSIYAFRGADINNINRFVNAFGEDCATYVLEQNYRSTQVVLDAANSLIGNNIERVPKNLWTDAASGAPLVNYQADDAYDEANFVAREIQKLCFGAGAGGTTGVNGTGGTTGVNGTAYNLNDIAIFYRSNVQSRVMEEVLIDQGLPYLIIGGTRFYERKEVRDAMGFLRAAVNPADEVAVKRVLNLPARGIGATSVSRIGEYARRQGVSFSEALRHAASAGVKGKALNGIAAFVKLHDALRYQIPAGPEQVLELALTESGYRKALEAENTDDVRSRLDNLGELLVSAARYETCDQFLEQVALVNDTDELPDSGMVSLMTLHSAKGLEYPVVFFTGLEESLCPHFRALGEDGGLEEERRLAYVGITRAQERLYLTHATRRATYGVTNYNTSSRFLEEAVSNINPEMLDDRSEYVYGRGVGY